MALANISSRGSVSRASGPATTSVINPSADVLVGQVLIATYLTDNISTDTGEGNSNTHSISDSKGNVWTKVFEKTYSLGDIEDGVTLSYWFSKITTQINIADTVTFTTSSNVSDAMGRLIKVDIAADKTLGYLTEIQFISGDNILQSYPISLTSLPSRQYMFVQILGGEGNTTTSTPAGSWVERWDVRTASGTPADTNLTFYCQDRLLTFSGDITATVDRQSFETINALIAFYEIDLGTVYDESITVSTKSLFLDPITLSTFSYTFGSTFTGVESFIDTFDETFDETFTDGLDHIVTLIMFTYLNESLQSSLENTNDLELNSSLILENNNIMSTFVNNIIEDFIGFNLQNNINSGGNINTNLITNLSVSIEDTVNQFLSLNPNLNLVTTNQTGDLDLLQSSGDSIDLNLQITDQFTLGRISELILNFISSAVIQTELEGETAKLENSLIDMDAVDTYNALIDFINNTDLQLDLSEIYLALIELLQELDLNISMQDIYTLAHELFQILNLDVYTGIFFDQELQEVTRPIDVSLTLEIYIKLRFFSSNPTLLKIIGATLIKYIKHIK